MATQLPISNVEALTPKAKAQALHLTSSDGFTEWLAALNIGLAFTTYRTAKLFVLGRDGNDRLSATERGFMRPGCVVADADQLYLATMFQIWNFHDALQPEQSYQAYDRLYVPQLACTTGDLDVHDLAVDGEGAMIFVNTLFSCLAAPSMTHSFIPLWRPPFISELTPEDRCHLSGVAVRDGRPAFVTAAADSDRPGGWKARRADGGVVVDVASGETVLRGLSMPAAPRWYRGELWLLDAGNGFFGSVDVRRGFFEPMTLLPGYARGLSLVGDYAVITISRPQDDGDFADLPLAAMLKRHGVEPRCGLLIIDLRSGEPAHWLSVEGPISELYDVTVLPRTKHPTALGLYSDDIRRMITVAPPESF